METLLNWLSFNVVNILMASGTLAAAYFAYRSAKMSERANKAQFSPFIVPTIFSFTEGNNRGTQPNIFWFQIENRSEYKNAFAKEVRVLINNKEINRKDWGIEENTLSINNFETIKPRQKIAFSKKEIDIKDFVPGDVKISYKDILGNKFETVCKLMNYSTDKGGCIDYLWEYKQ